jgi:hypothetical protein
VPVAAPPQSGQTQQRILDHQLWLLVAEQEVMEQVVVVALVVLEVVELLIVVPVVQAHPDKEMPVVLA